MDGVLVKIIELNLTNNDTTRHHQGPTTFRGIVWDSRLEPTKPTHYIRSNGKELSQMDEDFMMVNSIIVESR